MGICLNYHIPDTHLCACRAPAKTSEYGKWTKQATAKTSRKGGLLLSIQKSG